MTLRRTILILAFVLLAAVCLPPAARPQQTFGRCLVNIPAEWGTYKGEASGYGIVFEDNEGTLRFVKQLPCGLEGAPNVLVEVRRR
ncbi:MAG: hypothetical protein ACE14M_12600 [Terriglobales bacterium]